MFMGIVTAHALDVDGLVRIDPTAGHPVNHRAEAFRVQRRTVAMLRNLLADPIIDVVDEFTSAAVDFNDQRGVTHLLPARVQLGEGVRGPQHFPILETASLKGTQ